MKHYSRKEINDNLDYLKLLSTQYRNMPQVTARIVELNSGLNLPKGTEHFITDIHGENEAFEHVLRNCSGSIRRKSMEALGDSLDEKEFKATAGGGAVEVTMNGKKQITALNIDKDVVDPDDVEMLQDLVMAAVNEAIRQIEDLEENEMNSITGSLGGLGGGLGGFGF